MAPVALCAPAAEAMDTTNSQAAPMPASKRPDGLIDPPVLMAQERFRASDGRTLRIGRRSEREELLVIRARLPSITELLGGLRGAGERAEPVRHDPQRPFEGAQRVLRPPRFEQQF